MSEDVESYLHEKELEKERLCEVDDHPVGVKRSRLHISVVLALVGIALVAAIGGLSVLQNLVAICLVSSDSGRSTSALSRTFCTDSGICPLSELFLNQDVHEFVARSIVKTGAPQLGTDDIVMVRNIVAQNFKNISDNLFKYAPAVDEELRLLKINQTVKMYLLNAVELINNPQVQGFGRQVAKVIRSNPALLSDSTNFKDHVTENLSEEYLMDIQKFQAEEIARSTRTIWVWGEGHQWEMTFQMESIAWTQANSRQAAGGSRDAVDSLTAISGGALAEGRALLDLLLMCIRSKGPTWDTDLRGAAGSFLLPLAMHCEPSLAGGQSLDFGRSLICPLKFGMLGMDALRFSASLTGRPERSPCRRSGICPLRGLFFDKDVHDTVAEGLVKLGAPLLEPSALVEVRNIVVASFANVSSTVHKYAKTVGDELNDLEVNSTVKKYLLDALRLLHDPKVQGIGRGVGRALRSSSSLSNPEHLRKHIVKCLWQDLGGIQKLQLEVVPWPIRRIWSWGNDQQWSMTMDRDNLRSMEALNGDVSVPAQAMSTRDAAISGGALEESRALLDLMLMCIRSKGPSWSTSMDGAMNVFSGSLSTPCEPDPEETDKADFRSTLICPLKYGMLGLDALRFADHIFSSKHVERMPCDADGVCPLHELLFDPTVHERVSADIVRLAAEPHMLLGQADLQGATGMVASGFNNVSVVLRKHVPQVATELNELTVNQTVKEYILDALRLVSHPRVQDIGRTVARAIRSAPAFSDTEQLSHLLVKNLWREFADFQKYQQEAIQWPIRAIWGWAKDRQWQLTFALERARLAGALGNASVPSSMMPADAISRAVWAEGRALLDLMMMCILSKGPSWASSLEAAEDIFAEQLAVRCEPDPVPGRPIGFNVALLCPLRFGMMGMDALRFADNMFSFDHMEPLSCQTNGACPLGRLFFDRYVHEVVASDIIQVAAQPSMLLGEADMLTVQSLVKIVFRNISEHVHKYAGGIGEELSELKINDAEKVDFARAMELVANPRVQAFGREVARAINASSGFASPEDLKVQIVKHLRRRLPEMKNFADTAVQRPLLTIWGWSKERQWTMAVDAEIIQWIKTSGASTGQTIPSPPTATLAVETALSEQDCEIRGAALEEGRVLLDLMLMHIRSMGPHLVTSLFGTMDVFRESLSVRCSIEEPSLEARNVGLRETLLCPFKFGSLGLDAVRFAATGEHTQASVVLREGGKATAAKANLSRLDAETAADWLSQHPGRPSSNSTVALEVTKSFITG